MDIGHFQNCINDFVSLGRKGRVFVVYHIIGSLKVPRLIQCERIVRTRCLLRSIIHTERDVFGPAVDVGRRVVVEILCWKLAILKLRHSPAM